MSSKYLIVVFLVLLGGSVSLAFYNAYITEELEVVTDTEPVFTTQESQKRLQNNAEDSADIRQLAKDPEDVEHKELVETTQETTTNQENSDECTLPEKFKCLPVTQGMAPDPNNPPPTVCGCAPECSDGLFLIVETGGMHCSTSLPPESAQ